MPPSPVRRYAAAASTALRALACALALALAAPGHAQDDERMAAAAKRLGPRAVAAARALQPVLVQAAELDDVHRVRLVNGYVNRRIAFREDVQVWGQVDHWASPLEALARGEGDCEDYAIAKYFSLLAAGTPVERLRLVYVRARMPEGKVIAHMVLAYYAQPAAEPLILDNLVDDVRLASARPDLAPVFSFNSAGLWHGVDGASAGDPVVRLSKWRDVLARARAEGFL